MTYDMLAPRKNKNDIPRMNKLLEGINKSEGDIKKKHSRYFYIIASYLNSEKKGIRVF